MGEGQKPTRVTLTEAYYSLDLAFTLISISCLNQAGHIIHFKGWTCEISTPKPKSMVIRWIPMICGLYCITNPQAVSYLPHLTVNITSNLIIINELHHKMGHINHDDLHVMVRAGMVTGISLDSDLTSRPVHNVHPGQSNLKAIPQKEHK
jgi:hypothetical protein